MKNEDSGILLGIMLILSLLTCLVGGSFWIWSSSLAWYVKLTITGAIPLIFIICAINQ